MVKREKIDTKLGKLEEYIAGLEEKQSVVKTDYMDNQDLKDIVERRFEKAIQACLDIHPISQQKKASENQEIMEIFFRF